MKAILFISVCVVFYFNYVTDATGQSVKKSLLSEIAWVKNDGSFIHFKPGIRYAGNEIMLVYKKEFGLGDNDEMKIIRTDADNTGYKHYRYGQFYKGIPVEGAVFVIHELNEKPVSGNGYIIQGLKTDTENPIRADKALELSLKHVPSVKYAWEDTESENTLKLLKNNPEASAFPKPVLVIFDNAYGKNPENYRLAYKTEIYSLEPLERQLVFIDAVTGELIHKINMIQNTDVNATGVTRYNGIKPIVIDSLAAGSYRLRETGRGNGIVTKSMLNGTNYTASVDVFDDSIYFDSDIVAVNAHWSAEMTYDYYWNAFGRNSYDNNGAMLLSYVHFSNNYANAFWDGIRMTYGDGNGQYSEFTSLDVCAHEITHAVTENSANLVYQDEPGALNESFSDIFGSAVEYYASDSPNWLIGEDMGTPFRSMSNPNQYQNPDTYHGTYWDYDPYNMDNGGVHTNSGVANYWFYLLTEGGSGTNDIGNQFSVSGIGRPSSEAISYRTLTYYLTPSSQYIDAYLGSVQAAQDLFGACSEEALQCANAWYAVGVGYPYDSLSVYLIDISSPNSSCGLGLETVSVTLFYNGCNTLLQAGDTVSLAYQLDAGNNVYETFILDSNWQGGDSLNFTFNTPVDASGVGQHTLNCWAKYGSGFTDFTDSIKGYTFQTLLQQNIDVGVTKIFSPASDCNLSTAETVGVKILFYGCDSLTAGDTIDVAYKINNGTTVTEYLVLTSSIFPDDTITFTFTQPFDASVNGTYVIDAWTEYTPDTLNSNDLLSGYIVRNIGSLGYDTLGFEEPDALNYILLRTTVHSNVYIKPQAHAPGSTKGLLMTGGNAMTYIDMLELPNGLNTWLINEFLSAKATFCVNAATWNSAYLKFDLKQTHGGTLYSQYLGGNINDYNIASNLRLLANTVQIGGTYNPVNANSDPFVTHLIDLSNFAGSDFEMTFETRNIAKDTSIFIPFVLDNAYIDNVHFFPGPLAVDDSSSVPYDTVVTINVLANDNNNGISDILFNIISNPQNGNCIINSDTSVTYTPDFEFTGFDTIRYKICYTSDTTICDEAEIVIRVYEEQGITPLGNGEYFRVYPNPAGPQLTLEFFSSAATPVKLILTDLVGRNMMNSETHLLPGLNKFSLDLSEFPSGAYFLNIKKNGLDKIYKILKN